MKNELLDPVAPLLPIDFFTLGFAIPKVEKPFVCSAPLPSTAELLNEESFATFLMGWNEGGVCVEMRAKVPFQDCHYPEYEEGDSLELFFDTRDVKSAGYATAFCHHFVALPQPIYGIQVQEVTHFRSEATHPLCEPHLIDIETEFSKNGYVMRLFFPKEVLHGFDPNLCDRLGFTYKVNRMKGEPMHFSLSSKHVKIAQQPSLWASIQLENAR